MTFCLRRLLRPLRSRGCSASAGRVGGDSGPAAFGEGGRLVRSGPPDGGGQRPPRAPSPFHGHIRQPSVFCFCYFFLECPENCQNPRAHRRPLGRPHSLPSVCGHHLAKRTRAWRGCARALASFLGLGNVRSQVMTGTINAWLYLQILLWF